MPPLAWFCSGMLLAVALGGLSGCQRPSGLRAPSFALPVFLAGSASGLGLPEGEFHVVDLGELPLGLPAFGLKLLSPAGLPLGGVPLRLVDASGRLSLPLGPTNAEGLAQMPAQPDLDPLLLWRVESTGAMGPYAAWLPWPERRLAQAEPLLLEPAGGLAALALAPRLEAWGSLSHEAQSPFAEWVSGDLRDLVAALRGALVQLSAEESARLWSDWGQKGFDPQAPALQRIIRHQDAVGLAFEATANRLASAVLHAEQDGGPTVSRAAQVALSLGRATAPAVGDEVPEAPEPEGEAEAEESSGGGGGGGGGAAPPPVSLQPSGDAALSLNLKPIAGALGHPVGAEAASTAAVGVGP